MAAANPWLNGGTTIAGVGGPDGPNLCAPCPNVVPITLSDSVDLATVSRYIMVGASGNVTLTDCNANKAVVYMVAGYMYPIMATRLWNTGTAASGVVVLY